jgi:hypothetical protein
MSAIAYTNQLLNLITEIQVVEEYMDLMFKKEIRNRRTLELG